MEITKRAEGEFSVLALNGKLDTVAAPAAEVRLIEEMEANPNLILDFTDLRYIASSGLRILLKLQKAADAKAGSLKLIHVNQDVMEVLDLTGFSDFLTIE